MSPEDIARHEDIARAFVDCVGFRWHVGMVSTQRGLVVRVVGGEALAWLDLVGGGLIDDGDLDERPLPDTAHGPTLAIIAHVLLPAAWPGHSIQFWMWPNGTGPVRVFGPDAVSSSAPVFEVRNEPIAVSLLRCLENAP